MEVKQIFETVNESLKVATGSDFESVDLTGLVQEGNAVVAAADAKIWDNLHHALLDRVFRIVLSNRRYSPEHSTILRSEEVYGAIVEKVYIAPTEAQKNPSHDLVNGSSVDPFKVTLAEVKNKLFRDITTWEVPYTIADRDLQSAFRSAEEMAAFINGYEMQAMNSLDIQLDNVVSWARNNYIGLKSQATTGLNMIPLTTNYNKLTSGNLTSTNCLYDNGFVRYMMAQFNLFCYRMGRVSTVLNSEGFYRHSPMENINMVIHADAKTQIDSFRAWDARNAESLGMPKMDVVPFWQGCGGESTTTGEGNDAVTTTTDIYAQDTTMTVDITCSNGKAAKIKNVVGIVHDDNALGVSMYNRRVKNQYNGHGEYNNYWLKVDVGQYNDVSENGVVFTLN